MRKLAPEIRECIWQEAGYIIGRALARRRLRKLPRP